MSRALLLFVGAVTSALVLASCQDPVHENEVAALGGEAPGVSPGPNHRPGQPCLVCHGGDGPGNPQFAIAGTVFQIPIAMTGMNGVTVKVTDANKAVHTATTNGVGNFYINASDFSPTYPVDVELDDGDVVNQMLTHIGRDGSCATCHFDPAGPTTPGHVYLAGDLRRPARRGCSVKRAIFVVLASVVTCFFACSTPPSDARIGVEAPPRSMYPPVADLLDRGCGSLDCHGNSQRNLVMWGCYGLRLDPAATPGCRSMGGTNSTDAEYDASYRSLVGLEPAVMSDVVASHGANPNELTFVRKAFGEEAHKGGLVFQLGSDANTCIASWLAGSTNTTACTNALASAP